MTLSVQPIEPSALTARVAQLKDAGHRFVTLTALPSEGEAVRILYHFASGLDLVHLGLEVAAGGTVPSISKVFLAAVLVENEIQDQFGVRFDGIAVDYNRRFYLEDDIQYVPFTSKVKLAPGDG